MLVIEYLYNLDLSQKSFTIQGKYFITDVYKCTHAMYDMHDPNGSSVWSTHYIHAKFVSICKSCEYGKHAWSYLQELWIW